MGRPNVARNTVGLVTAFIVMHNHPVEKYRMRELGMRNSTVANVGRSAL
jgi:hypothetical protein